MSEIGKKIAERWLTILLLPGLLFTGVLCCAWLLGHDHALDGPELARRITAKIAPLHQRPVSTVVVLFVLLLIATASAYVAQALTGAVNAVWTARRPRRLVDRRRSMARVRHAKQPLQYLPDRLTPAGDYWRLAGERIATHYQLDLLRLWPRLWLLLSPESRTVVQNAYGAYHGALTLTGWGLLYLAVGCWWWPAAVGGAVVVVIAFQRGTQAAAETAELLEAVVDLNIGTLAASIDAADQPVIDEVKSVRITNILNKRQILD
jgi:hypothetical protein